MTRPAVQSADDLELVAAVRAGDDRAFELLFERYQARITSYVRGMVRDHGRAEDITQDVFIAALRRMRATDREIAFKPWIFEIAKNACIDAFRRGRNTLEVSIDADEALGPADQRRLVATEPAPDTVIDTKLALDDLCGAFGGLSQTHHDILVKRELEGLSYREIGTQLGMSQGAVESTLFRARRRLGEEYAEISSGERCTRVRQIADASAGRALGLREQRRMRRHVTRCQPCMRYVLSVGVDFGATAIPGSRTAKVAALLPLPALLRRRGGEPAGQLVGSHPHAASIAGALDPVSVSGWGKAVFTAAAVAVAGVGAGGAASQRDDSADVVPRGPAVIAQSQARSAADQVGASGRSEPGQARESAVERSAVDADGTRSQSAVSPARDGTGSASAGDEPLTQRAPERGSSSAKTSEPALPKDARREPASTSSEPASGPVGPLRGLLDGIVSEGSQSSDPGVIREVVAGVGGRVKDLVGGRRTAASGGQKPAAADASQDAERRPAPKPVKVVRDVVGALTAGRK